MNNVNKFLEFVKELKVLHPQNGLIPFEMYDYLVRYITTIEENRFVLGVKFRQGAFTTTSILYALWKAQENPNYKVNVFSTTLREAEYLTGLIQHFLKYLPVEIDQVKSKEINFSNGSKIWFSTWQAACGRAIDLAIFDEAAFHKEMDKAFAAVIPTLGENGKLVAVSSANGQQGWFYKTYNQARAGIGRFVVFQAEHTEHPNYQDKEFLEMLRKNLGEKGFRQEILCEFLPVNPPTPTSQELFAKFIDTLTAEETAELIEKLKWLIK